MLFRSFLLNGSPLCLTILFFSWNNKRRRKVSPHPSLRGQRGREMKSPKHSGAHQLPYVFGASSFSAVSQVSQQKYTCSSCDMSSLAEGAPCWCTCLCGSSPLVWGWKEPGLRAQFEHDWPDTPGFPNTSPSWSTGTRSRREVTGVTFLVQQENWIQRNISSNALREQAWHIISIFLSDLLPKEDPSMAQAASVYSENYPWDICLLFALELVSISTGSWSLAVVRYPPQPVHQKSFL